ncbi:hypothetical protein [Azorhizobium doebereinerae]|uniref:hypothetical protein n=1 Tax=Azorhizobium doebereinerae TaxID=281091 RepID=UPI00040A34C3|nr:hypothetical protein [Azorhizobium doebereinerae]
MPFATRRGTHAAAPFRTLLPIAACLLLLPTGTTPAWPQAAGAPAASADAVNAQEATALLRRAGRQWANGKKEDAVFWFYAGQLRFRAFLAAHPDLDPSGAPALFASLMESLGQPINAYAFGDISALIRTIDKVLTWDEANPEPGLPPAARQSARAGLIELRDKVRIEAAAIRAEREAKGLENR